MAGKIASLDELKKIRERSQTGMNVRTEGENPNSTILAVGMATCGIAAGARTAMQALLSEIADKKVTGVSVIATGCIGFCFAEPIVEVREVGKAPIRYGAVDEARAKEIINKHILKGELLDNAIVDREVPRA